MGKSFFPLVSLLLSGVLLVAPLRSAAQDIPLELLRNYYDTDSTPLVGGCPQSCLVSGPEQTNWTQIHDDADLTKCDLPLLFDFNVQNTPSRYKTIRVCAVEAPSTIVRKSISASQLTQRDLNAADREAVESAIAASNRCGAQIATTSLPVAAGAVGEIVAGADAAAAADALATYIAKDASCGVTILFAKSGNAVVGVYAGADVPKNGVGGLISRFGVELSRGRQAVEICDATVRESRTVGLFAVDSVDELENVQVAIQTWANGGCMSRDGMETLEEAQEINVLVAAPPVATPPVVATPVVKRMAATSSINPNLAPRATCRVIQVYSGDGCASLATRCGITAANFMTYNTKENLCSTLAVNQWVCCSAGTLPDMTPQPQADGTCAVHEVAAGEGCWAIADNFGITQTRIENVNKKTWGWAGCDSLQIGQRICLSTGNPPMPAQVEGVACGPQKPGTKKPAGNFTSWDLAALNPCALNACCDGWGYCGTTEEFCVNTTSATGNAGTMETGTNGCISNCGMDVVRNDYVPVNFKRVGYFEAWNAERLCLHMGADDLIYFDELTHVHFAFVGITETFEVRMDDVVKVQFDKFVALDAPFKKIVSFGGWAESTDPATFQRYRNAVKAGNREIFAANVMAFLNKYNLDGVDFDWEYPGATDMPGIPPAGESEGLDYLAFLTLMREHVGALDTGAKSISIALPASYWYLKPFPVARMNLVLDYFVYMTYDLHGQWDYGNPYSNPGCPTGNCLRSHVNKTETYNALAMLTKASVPARKIVVGVASYGRSFGMNNATCTTRGCRFTGSFSESTAEPGFCTGTAGYISNAELYSIMEMADSGLEGFEYTSWYNALTDSDMMTYRTQGNDITTWVAYMNEETKAGRIEWIKSLNFGGASDWALDLANDIPSVEITALEQEILDLETLECDSTNWPGTLVDIEAQVSSIEPDCRGQAILDVLLTQLNDAIISYEEVSVDYNDKFNWYVTWVKESIDPALDEFMAIGRGEGNKYMDCVWSSTDVAEASGPCTEAVLGFSGALTEANTGRVEYTMRDEDGFYQALLENYGIEKSWVKWEETHLVIYPCDCRNDPSIPVCACRGNSVSYANYPRRVDDDSLIDVQNPKALVDEAIPSLQDLADEAFATFLQLRLGAMAADDLDVVTAISMPTFMLQDAVASIKVVKEIGEQEKEAKSTELIMNILNIVFMIIPFAGTALKAIGGFTQLARVILIIGEASNAALTIADIVKDPASAPFAIVGMLTGAAGIRAKGPREAFKTAADARRALSNDQLKLFSNEFRRKDAIVQNVMAKCTI